MSKRIALFLALAIFITATSHADSLVFNRGLLNSSSQSVGWTKDAKAFLADDFRVGKKGESWMIDRIRMWALSAAGSNAMLGDLYSKMTLFGGLVDTANSKQPRPPDDCDCHGLIRPIKAVDLDRQRLSPTNPDLKISQVANGGLPGKTLLQIDFENLRWSVPGGADVQFGIQATSRANAPGVAAAWLNYAVPGEPDHLRVFENSGKFQSMYESREKPVRIGVQAWAHLLIEVSIRARQSALEVIIKGSPSFDVKQLDRRTLRLGTSPLEAAARFEDSDADGRPDAVFTVSRQAASIPANAATVCVTGTRLDGISFEGCNLVPR